ncbi:cyclohexanone 1,2-monooxygenase [Colletotrichum costaricense]|uniref:Cyclohexanone 1,2-monooxygenase n=3 Tax=Colletotrichum acutatum species complex TaxID=2707335 RepID=A0AAI9YIU1_9PEZI|nr:cyclohexanone 1,2-monooxygenase [Colletotrichum costaricense]XP_060380702.1 cyclohexanone 1,2-monooxygenase [Colletotrichum tamarilloi]KAI3545604.1 cyclohexanone 1,2-monooxygenase [Colletotrichum filicis]KAK0371266.1 cyclohexanone 1,2-monooxygenase [Colletotrichum limetticola]KAK1495280.1 cyclohexanone 1,2-monooxygenase [Colletotrichum tamarilloi]KAK1511355.1 cyclohexanone 1,2-monooxygenase [Colletotrichum costaricense]
MTASVEAPATAPVDPGPVATSRVPNDVPRMPAPELPEVVQGNAKFPQQPSVSNHNGVSDDPFKLDTKFAYTPRKIKVFTIGAGFSGLLMAHKFQHRFPEMRDIVEHTIFEAHSEVGGTWLVNNYPGVQCDVPAHIYAFPFDPNPDWSRFYASGAEILQYMKDTVKKWNLDRDLQLNTKVVGATWQEELGQWKVTVEHQGEQRDEFCHVLISAQGVLVHESWPDVPGLRDFEGHITHSARWDHDFDYSNKRIAVIGNGSSGIQIVPQMAKLPGTDVLNFIRGPAWVYYRAPPSKHLGRDDPDPNPRYTDEERKKFHDPEYHLEHRKGIISRTNKSFYIFMKGENNKEGMRLAAAQMAEKLGHDPELCEKLIPKWELGCRRITPGPGYLESFLRPNCNITNSAITSVSKNGVHTADGKFYECDVIVCATGFDVSHRPRYPIVGKENIDLATRWAEDPDSYVSVAVPDYPNYFMMMGPNCLGGHGSLVESLNWTGDYFVKWVKKMATEDIKYVEPKQEVVDAFIKYSDQVHKTLVWSGGCKSWYKRNRVDGRVTALFGGSAHLFNRMLSNIRGEDFNICYRTSNPFRFMGNGFTEWEMDSKSDLSWYVEKAEVLGKV